MAQEGEFEVESHLAEVGGLGCPLRVAILGNLHVICVSVSLSLKWEAIVRTSQGHYEVKIKAAGGICGASWELLITSCRCYLRSLAGSRGPRRGGKRALKREE